MLAKKWRRVLSAGLLRGSSVLVCLLACIVVLQVVIITDMQCDRTSENARQLDQQYMTALNSRNHLSEEQQLLFNYENKNKETNNFWGIQTCSCGLHFRVDREAALVYPVNTTSTHKFLTIGIPTIKRRDDSYLLETVMSLVANMAVEQQQEVLIVIMLADIDPENRKSVAEELYKSFEERIKSGQIQIIQPPSDFYEPLKITKHTYKQGAEYVQWRAKQNFDYAFLMRFSANLSLYYMQLEDDVTTVSNYINSIRKYIDQQSESWTCLEFSELGFIGKLYRSKDVVRLAQLLLMFYQEQPVDYTYLYFNMLTTQFQKRIRVPTLFQHRGIHSSFPGKVQHLKDRLFDQMEKKYKGDNPKATIYTTLQTYLSFMPQLAYSKTEGFFWSHGSPSEGDIFVVVFDEPQTVDRVIVDTGSENHPTDILASATLLASLTVLKNAERFDCTNDIPLGDFQDGRVDVKEVSEKVKFKIVCLQIKVTKQQSTWAIIREIAVFLRSN